MGEGWSMGPMNATMKRQETERQGDIKYDIEWTTLGDYFGWLEKRDISHNIASFVGAATVRVHELGEMPRFSSQDRKSTHLTSRHSFTSRMHTSATTKKFNNLYQISYISIH